MDESLVSALMAGIGVILSAWLGFAGTRKGTLATAEKDFRATILEENKVLRSRVGQLETKLLEVQKENHLMNLKMIEISTIPVTNTDNSVNIIQVGGESPHEQDE